MGNQYGREYGLGERRTCTERCWIFNKPTLDLGMKRGHALVIKRDFTAYKDIQHYAKAPDVDLRTSINFGAEELWCSKVEGATECGQLS